MSQIRIFNSAAGNWPFQARHIALEDVNIVTQNISVLRGGSTYGKPYIMFEHKDYPLGALMAFYDGDFWQCDLD